MEWEPQQGWTEAGTIFMIFFWVLRPTKNTIQPTNFLVQQADATKESVSWMLVKGRVALVRSRVLTQARTLQTHVSKGLSGCFGWISQVAMLFWWISIFPGMALVSRLGANSCSHGCHLRQVQGLVWWVLGARRGANTDGVSVVLLVFSGVVKLWEFFRPSQCWFRSVFRSQLWEL